jgi:hypothetical protein
MLASTRIGICALVLVLISAPLADVALAADDNDVQLQCWISTETGTGWPYWAAFASGEFTSKYSGAPVDATNYSLGWDFAEPNGTDGQGMPIEEEIRCSLVVPSNYSTSSVPKLKIMGWSTADVNCTGLGCNLTLQVEFTVNGDTYAAEERLDYLWGNDNTGTLSWDSETCDPGVSTDKCFKSDRLKTVEIDILDTASTWSAGNLVLMSIRRTPSGAELPSDFHIAALRLKFARSD